MKIQRLKAKRLNIETRIKSHKNIWKSKIKPKNWRFSSFCVFGDKLLRVASKSSKMGLFWGLFVFGFLVLLVGVWLVLYWFRCYGVVWHRVVLKVWTLLLLFSTASKKANKQIKRIDYAFFVGLVWFACKNRHFFW